MDHMKPIHDTQKGISRVKHPGLLSQFCCYYLKHGFDPYNTLLWWIEVFNYLGMKGLSFCFVFDCRFTNYKFSIH